jgi:hypothetical protein
VIDVRGDEGGTNAAAVADGSTATGWHSHEYHTAEYGRLKPGIGLLLRLAVPAEVHEVAVNVQGTGGLVEVRTANGAGEAGSTLLGSAPITGSGRVTVPLTTQPATRAVLLWFPRLPQSAGKYRLEIAEVYLR